MKTLVARSSLHRLGRVASIVALLLAAGCAQTFVQTQAQTTTRLPKPGRVLVYDFAVTPDEIHADQDILHQVVNAASDTSIAARDAVLGHQVADRFADELVSRIQTMGLSAVRAGRAATATAGNQNDLKIIGAFLDVDQGNQVQRLVIGFGVGASKVDTEVELLQVAGTTLRRVAQFSTHADSGDMPGAAVTMGAGAAASGGLTAGVAAANVAVSGVKGYRSDVERMAGRSADKAGAYLSQIFTQQGWIAAQP